MSDAQDDRGYWALRTEGVAGCDFGKALIAETTATSYVDGQVASGRPYHYNVVAAGASPACFSRVSNCASVNANANDVDGGLTSIGSPPIALPSSGTLTLSFAWYLAHGSNASSADFFRLKVVAGTTTTLLNVAGSAVNRNGAWGTATLSLNAFAGQTVRLLFEATDSGPDSLIEAAVDDVKIVQE